MDDSWVNKTTHGRAFFFWGEAESPPDLVACALRAIARVHVRAWTAMLSCSRQSTSALARKRLMDARVCGHTQERMRARVWLLLRLFVRI